MGFQYEPVLSIATWVQPLVLSQSTIEIRASIIVENVQILGLLGSV